MGPTVQSLNVFILKKLLGFRALWGSLQQNERERERGSLAEGGSLAFPVPVQEDTTQSLVRFAALASPPTCARGERASRSSPRPEKRGFPASAWTRTVASPVRGLATRPSTRTRLAGTVRKLPSAFARRSARSSSTRSATCRARRRCRHTRCPTWAHRPGSRPTPPSSSRVSTLMTPITSCPRSLSSASCSASSARRQSRR